MCLLSIRLRLLAPANHYDLVVYGGVANPPAHPALAHAVAPMSSTPINKVSKRTSGGGDSPSSPVGLQFC